MTRTDDRRDHAPAPERHEERIPLDPRQPLELAVHNPNGAVLLRATDRADVLIRATKTGRSGSRRYEHARLVVEVDHNRIKVHPVLPPSVDLDLDLGPELGREIGRLGRKLGGLFGAPPGDDPDSPATTNPTARVAVDTRGNVRYDLEIEIPSPSADRPEPIVEVRTASGDAALEGVTGRLRVATASGDARLRDAAGTLAIDTASGDLHLVHPRGVLTARTASGDVRVEDAALDRCMVTTASGDLALDVTLTGRQPLDLRTVSGDVRLTLGLPPGTGAALAFQTVSGDASVDGAAQGTGRRAWRLGPSDAPGPDVSVRTVSGDLHARVRDAAASPAAQPAAPRAAPPDLAPTEPIPPTPPLPPLAPLPPISPEPASSAPAASVPPVINLLPEAEFPSASEALPPPADRLDVLRALERGDIDIDEALSRLDPDQDPQPPPTA